MGDISRIKQAVSGEIRSQNRISQVD
jgi:hypothetical protein